MARPTRMRRPPLKFLDDDVAVEAPTIKTSNKVARRSDDEETAIQTAAAPKTQLAKGNLLAGKKNVARRLRSPVLRDRTNLPEEALKVDILVKKGADDKTRAAKAPKATRLTAKSVAATEENGAEAPGRAKSLRPRAKNLATEKENSEKVPETKAKTKEKMKAQATEEARNEKKEKAKKAKMTKAAAPAEDEENSLVIESENVADVENPPKVRSIRSGGKKIGKRVASSRLSTSRQTKLSVDKLVKKSISRSPDVRKKAETATKSNVEGGKKFFKTKAPGAAVEKSAPVRKTVTKRREIGVKKRPSVSTSFRLRQTTLSESFAKQALKKALRPRTTQRNYREMTILEKTKENEKVKGPVYKTAKLSDKSDDDGSEIYEFQFDKNDSRERIPKKKKRKRNVGVAPRKTRAKAPKKTIAAPKAAANNAAKVDEAAKEPQPQVPAAFDEPMDTNDAPDSDSPIAATIQPKKIEPQASRGESKMPKILESVELTGEKRIELTATPQLAKSGETNVRPMRPTVQYKTMLKHVLLNRSLSPIKKALENFDPGSPWRPPIIAGPQFSRVKNVVQSTPQVRKFSAMLEKKNAAESTSQPPARKIKVVENDENKDKAKPAANQLSPLKASGLAKSPRKFGTVISNVNVSSPAIHEISASPAIRNISESQGSPRKMENVESPRLVDPSVSRISDGCGDFDNFDDHADKENSVPGPTSPKKTLKSPMKTLRSPTKTLKSPMKTLKSPKKLDMRPLRPFNQKATTKENSEPQPGPSGLQKRSPLGESRILKQSNLHNFLNIDELPTSTRITTAHGIFADAHSTPITGKPVKTIAKEANVENAFGFDEPGDSDIELSPIKNSLFADPPTAAKKIVVPTRFSIGEIKKHLRPVVAKNNKKEDDDDPVKRIEAAEKENREGKKVKAEKENEKVDVKADFTDTFDVLNAAEENAEETVAEIPLFADLEPVHFKQPPRHSYKRKRIAFNFSEDEDNDAESSFTEHDNNRGTKKRKVSKVEKQRQKKLEEWAKNLNNTFEEIEHFDLLVE